MTRTKNNTQINTKPRRTPRRNIHLEKNIFVFFDRSFFIWFFICNFFKKILQEMLIYRLGTVNDIYWGFKPVLSYNKPHTFSAFSEKKKK